MILLDANILLYAYNASAGQHARARDWLQSTLSRPDPVALCWTTILAFLRLTTNPRVFEHPFLADEVLPIVSSWLSRPNVVMLHESDRHWQIFSNLVDVTHARGPHITDAHLAALAIEHGAHLGTTDRDFSRFPGLHTVNPLTE